MRAYPVAVAAFLLWAGPGWAVCGGPGPNTTTIPGTGQNLGVVITAPPNNTQVPIPPGTQLVEANCAIGSVPGQPINLLYVVDVSGSTDRTYMQQNGIQLVDANGDGVITALDDYNGDGEAGETLDGEISGVLALNASIGNPLTVRVGVTAFASSSVNADMGPAGGDQKFTVPPQNDANANLRSDVEDVLRSLRSEHPSGGTIGQFTAKGPGSIGNSTDFIDALTTMNATLAAFHRPGPTSCTSCPTGSRTRGYACTGGNPTGACLAALNTAVAAGTKIYTVGVGASADPADLACIANYTGGTFVQVTDPSDLAAVLPSITPKGIDHVEIDGVTVPIDGLGNFDMTVPCPGNSPPQPFTVTATCVATDEASTTIEACITLTCYNLCGNNVVDPGAGEECDPPNTATCDATCQRVPACGDTHVDAPEECEPPNGPNCDASCMLIACGNNVVQPGEECEPPNTPTCDGSCQRVPTCGDNHVDAPETCEPPGVGGCDSDCTAIVCGNGELELGEECEPPNSATCDATCQRVPVCGDGLLDGTEQCEPAGTATCDAQCRTIVCGNSVVQPGEECEPPNTATCDATCQRVPACGDTNVDAPEECEPPNGPNCDATCRLIACGNGVVQAGEECEPPNTTFCDAGCQRVSLCGDGFIDAPETCDPPNGLTCDTDCTVIECGNGQVEVAEECDPPNTASCDAVCQRMPVCGDGLIDIPETCEPPNTLNCDGTCMLIACGNGVVQPGEECEPPNTATCDATCQRVPTCGDSLLDPPQEQCEPPNTPTCGATCLLQELCMDGADNDGDGLIDCLDPDCPVCPPPKKDPATIKFGRVPGTDPLPCSWQPPGRQRDLTFDPANAVRHRGPEQRPRHHPAGDAGAGIDAGEGARHLRVQGPHVRPGGRPLQAEAPYPPWSLGVLHPGAG